MGCQAEASWGTRSTVPIPRHPHSAQVNVTGEGFSEPARCQFAPNMSVPATVMGPGLLQCLSPKITASTSCQREALEVMLTERVLTENRVQMLRVATPTILSVDPPRGEWSRAQNVTLRGYGFQASAHVACRFRANGVSRVVRGEGHVTVLSSTRMMCQQPRLEGPLPPPSYLEVRASRRRVQDRGREARGGPSGPPLQIVAPCGQPSTAVHRAWLSTKCRR